MRERDTSVAPDGHAAAPSVAVVGANGHTGTFVVAELERRGLTPVAVGRDRARLAARGFGDRGVSTRVASIEDPASLERALAGVAVVINCAGPFLETASAVATAAVRAGAHYLDVTAEQASVTATLDAFHTRAQQAGVTVVPAMGFFGGLADLLCSAAAGGSDRIDEVRIAIALDRWHPTAGTRSTGRRNTARRLVVEAGDLTPVADPPSRTTVEFAAPFGAQAVTEVPFSEVPLIARHLPVRRLRTWLTESALRDLRDPSTPPPEPQDASGRSAQRFLVEVLVTSPDGTRRASARGRDIYAVTAPLVVEAAQRLVNGERRRSGAFPPGAAFDAAAFLAAFPADVLTVELSEPGVADDPAGPRPTA